MKLADYPGKRGVTLVEVLVVVTIMGILSGIGVAGLRNAMMNSRIKDAGINVTAFMERAANEATRLNSKACVTVSGKTLKLYKGACNVKHANTDLIDDFTLESANTFLTTGSSVNCPDLPAAKKAPASSVPLEPKIGLSPVPAGCLLVRYSSSDRYASIIKLATKFSVYYKLSYDSGSSWFEP